MCKRPTTDPGRPGRSVGRSRTSRTRGPKKSVGRWGVSRTVQIFGRRLGKSAKPCCLLLAGYSVFTAGCVILHPQRKLCSGCNKWTAPTERWTAVAREGRRCPRACHTQAVCEDPVENGRAAGEQHQISCCQVCVDTRSAVTCAACCSLHLSSRAQCTSQPRTHHVRSQCRRFRPGCRRPDRAEADEATHRRGRPRWL